MTWGVPKEFSKAIVHIDGDGFFAACEVAKDPTLRGKPVVTGKERGIVSAATYEAKRRGIVRGMQLHEVRKICPEAVILPSDYETYSLFSRRMYEIVRRYTPTVEEYGIDECFGDLSGLRRMHRMPYTGIARRIKEELNRELGMTFSVGLGPTKVLAKLGSKWKKPDGFTVIGRSEAPAYLAKTPLRQVWGIGHNTACYLEQHGMKTAGDLARKEEGWVMRMLSKPYIELWHELRGDSVLALSTDPHDSYQSIQKTKTFTPPSTDAAFIYSQLSKNIENACIKARRYGLATDSVHFFLKTQEFRYHGMELKLPYPTNVPQDMLRAVQDFFPQVYRAGVRYRATGVTLAKLASASTAQLDLFGERKKAEGLKKVYESVDELSERYGKHAVFLGSSFKAMTRDAHAGDRGELPERRRTLLKGETARKRLSLPFLGEVS